jgi:hypothetical protein
MEYFVKWNGFAENENSWVKEADFDTTEIIEDYWGNRTNVAPDPTPVTALVCLLHQPVDPPVTDEWKRFKIPPLHPVPKCLYHSDLIRLSHPNGRCSNMA